MSRQMLKTALKYASIVFGIGFVLGALRLSLLVPRVGTRAAELLELPLMLGASALTARHVVRAHADDRTPTWALGVGGVALALLLGAEVVLGVALRRVSPLQVLFDHDPISGTAYYASLLVFALFPWWFASQMDAHC
jgi:hypothetical protein